MKRVLTYTALVVVVAALASGAFSLQRVNAGLRGRVAEMRQRSAAAEQMKAENDRLKAFLAQTQSNQPAATQAFQTELMRVRKEVAELEQRAETRRTELLTQTVRAHDAMAANRDPAKGLTRLEYFSAQGQATPGAAVQTLVWAAMKGETDALAQAFALSDAARAKAEAIIAGLPEEARSKWSPEKLAAMFFAGFLTEVSAAELAPETLADAQHATVDLRVTDGLKTSTIPLALQSSPAGWQVVVSDRYMDVVRKKIASMDRK